MHACGHGGQHGDAARSGRGILGIAGLSRTVHFVFQSAEQGGAMAMAVDGFVERFPVDTVCGLHSMPGSSFAGPFPGHTQERRRPAVDGGNSVSRYSRPAAGRRLKSARAPRA
ncbi:hypothetical protein [Mesorhizobium tianshanense]